MKRHPWKFLAFLIQGAVLSLILNCPPVHGASFDINPVRLEFTNENQLEKLSIKNLSESDFTIQIRAYEWRQNEAGEDVYTETGDIIVFPKMTTIKRGEESYIRLGTKVVSGKTEKTYRVYIEEMPSGPSENRGASIRLYTKVGIPVFVRPPAPESRIEIEDISMQDGNIGIRVRNGGNSHFILTGVRIQGSDESGAVTFDREIGGWYHLSGTGKVYSTSIPAEVCSGIRNFSIEVQTKNKTLTKQIPVTVNICRDEAETAENS